MKKKSKLNLIISILMIFTVFSILYYINSNRLEIKKDNNDQHQIPVYDLFDLIIFDCSGDGFSFYSTINIQEISPINNYFENLLKKSEEITYIISINCICSSAILLLIKSFSNNKENKKDHRLEIDGVHVTEDEVKILNIIEEFLNSNRIFNKDKVIFYITSKSNHNLNIDGVKKVVDHLLEKNLIMEGSKLTRRTILLNLNREKIFTLIKQSPGIYKNKISKLLNLCPFIINWHLSKLLSFNLIRKRNINGQTCYFDYFLSKINDSIYNTLNKEKCRKIIEFLMENQNGCTKNQISRELNMHYNTVNRYINKIDHFDLLNRNKSNHIEYLTLNTQIFQQILTEFHNYSTLKRIH